MSIEIIYYAPDSSLGDNSSEYCQKFRAWAHAHLQRRYVDCSVEVSPKDGANFVHVSGYGVDKDAHYEEEILDYLGTLWDNAPIFTS